MDKLLVAVIGHRNSGKSTTWNKLFERKRVNTGKNERTLYLGEGESVLVFVVSGSPEERNKYVGDIVVGNPQIVLCSIQYCANVLESLGFFIERDFFPFVHWLNPGYEDKESVKDIHGLIPYLTKSNLLFGLRDGKLPPDERVGEMRDFIRGWAKSRGLVQSA